MQGRRHASKASRVEFLKKHPGLLFKGCDGKAIVEAMKRAGLVAPTTYWKDVRLEPLLEAARRSEEAGT